MTQNISQRELTLRQRIERKIARCIVTDAIKLGYTVDVDNGGEVTLSGSTSVRNVLRHMFTVDDERLILRRGKESGWIYFVYGNDGYDVVNDYTINLEPVMERANKMADEYDNG